MNYDQAMELAISRSDCHPNNIHDLAALIAQLKYLRGDIVEIGSYKCGASIALAASVHYHTGIGQTGKIVYAFDTFGGLPYENQQGFENFADVDWEEVKAATAPFEIILVRGRHEDTIPNFIPRQLSLIFMDSDHYLSHYTALTHLWPMLSHGGIVVFHDWAFPQVQQAVNDAIPKKEIARIGDFETSPNMKYIAKA